MTRKLFNPAITFLFTASLLFANTSDIDKEMGELFGTSEKNILISTEPNNDFLIEENSPNNTTTQNLQTPSNISSSGSTAPSLSTEIIATPTRKRSENLRLTIQDKSISYTLPSSLEDVVIELLSLDGSILKTTNHSKNESVGSFDTSILNEGYYIVRVTDSIQKSNRIARAVAIKH